MFRVCIGFFVLGAVVAYRTQVDHIGNESQDSELPCLLAGGLCVMAGDCPDGQLAETSSLCPRNHGMGMECCYGLPKSDTRCIRHGGECMPLDTRCPDTLTYSEASDCEHNEKCCILVK